jgi:hypothetical protein
MVPPSGGWTADSLEALPEDNVRRAEDGIYEPSGTFTDVIDIEEPWKIQIAVSSLRPRNL